MKNLTTILISFLLMSHVLSAQTQAIAKTDSRAEKLATLMEHCAENGMFNGVVLVAEKGHVIYRDAFGYADQPNNQKLTTDHAFYLASVSKQFTTMGIMILKEQGKLSYDDPLSKYFPEFPSYANNVTIRHMMTHTSGIADHYGLNLYKPQLTNQEVVDRLVKQEELDFEPGDRYSYSNGGYVLLSMIVAKVSGMPFRQFMKEQIFKPLGMHRTLVYDESEPKVKMRAKGHGEMGGMDDYEIFTTGAGGMFSTVDDLLKWDRALYREKLVSTKTLAEAYMPTKLNDGSLSDYGFGWGVREDDGRKVVAHSGGMNGYRTFIRRDLANDQVHIILTNYGDGVEMGGINSGIENIMNGEPFDLPKMKTSSLISQLLNENELETAMRLIEEKLESGEYENDEMGINGLGYTLMGEKEFDQAKAVFAFNIEKFPASANTYDSMGEAYMLYGDTTKAIEYYRKSIELNPNNTNGISMLEKMGVDKKEFEVEVVIPIDVLDTYIGKYELNPGFVLTILREGSQMKIHPSGQSVSDIFPSSQTRFYSKIVDAQITFNVDENGKVPSLTLHQGGDFEAKRVE